jgi:S-adenosylmethionine synthetase
MTTLSAVPQFAEYVSPGHPDRLADAVAEYLVTGAVQSLPEALCGIEVAVHELQMTITGRIATAREFFEEHQIEVNAGALGTEYLAEYRLRQETLEGIRAVYQSAGYGGRWQRNNNSGCWVPPPEKVEINSQFCMEQLGRTEAGIRCYSDDQNIVIGYASDCAATNHLPPVHYLSLTLGRRLHDCLRHDPQLAQTFGPDFKVLCTCRSSHGRDGARFEWERLTFSAQHCPFLGFEEQHRLLVPVVSELLETLESEGLENVATGFDPRRHLVLNGAGDFVTGGPYGDNGLSGKKLVVDHYGPTVPIGGGALCGKDPHKVDRCGALRARQLARDLVRNTGAQEAKVTLSWSPGEEAPGLRIAELVENGRTRVVTDSGLPAKDWFSINAICDDLNLLQQDWVAVMRAGYFADHTHPWER